MGRKPRTTKPVRIPIETLNLIEARAEGREITGEVDRRLRWSLENEHLLTGIHMAGDISAMVADYVRLKRKEKKK